MPIPLIHPFLDQFKMESPSPSPSPTMEKKKESRVRVTGMLTVVSGTPVEPGRSIRLSPLDHAMARHTVRIVYYYSRAAVGPMDFDRLRLSLCGLLSAYPTLTGRLAHDDDGNWIVRFTDSGVRAYRANVGATLDEWLRSADAHDEKDLTAWDPFPDDPHIWPPFRIQFNDFECGGIAIGLSFTHLLSDPTTASLFFHSWSESHRQQPLSHPPSFQPDALRLRTPPSTATTDSASKSNPSTASAATATATFSFSDESIRQRLSKIGPDASPFDLLAALFWTRINAPEVADNYGPCHSLSICVDFRKRLHAPLPYGYFGNAVHFTRLAWEAGDLGHVAGLIHRHVAGVKEEEVRSTLDWLESRKDDKGRYGEPLTMYGPELTCVNMEHLIECGAVYTSEFGDGGKPVHVSYDVEGAGGLIWVMPSPEGGMGRRVKVVLAAELVATLCKDDAIRSLAPTMVISGGLVLGDD